jgi:hypothetical protein
MEFRQVFVSVPCVAVFSSLSVTYRISDQHKKVTAPESVRMVRVLSVLGGVASHNSGYDDPVLVEELSEIGRMRWRSPGGNDLLVALRRQIRLRPNLLHLL